MVGSDDSTVYIVVIRRNNFQTLADFYRLFFERIFITLLNASYSSVDSYESYDLIPSASFENLLRKFDQAREHESLVVQELYNKQTRETNFTSSLNDP